MNAARKWLITLLILALPMASMASITNIHCMDSTESKTLQIEYSSADHCNSSNDTNSIKNSSLSTECSCDCNDTLGCLNNSANGFALTTSIKFHITFSDSHLNLDKINQLVSFHSPPLTRPPITAS